MPTASSFLSANMCLVFFIHGLAFFIMGLVVALESRRTSTLRLATGLVYLAVFGVLTGIIGWLDMIATLPGLTPSPTNMPQHQLQPINCFECHVDPTLPEAGNGAGFLVFLDTLKIGLMAVGTLSLCRFGTSLIDSKGHQRLFRALPLILLTAWLITMIPVRMVSAYGPEQWLANGGILARYTLLLPASLIAGIGLLHQRPRLREMGLPQLARDCGWAAGFFFAFAIVGGLIVPPGGFHPANQLNYSSFFALTGVPVQVVRAGIALAIAYFVVRILRVFAIEYDRRLETAIIQRLHAQQEALEAQQLARQSFEAWNRQLEERVQQRTRELEERNRELAAVNSVTNAISQSFELSEVLRLTLENVLRLSRATAGAIYLLDSDRRELVIELEMGTTPWLAEIGGRVALGEGHIGTAAATGQTVCSTSQGCNCEADPSTRCGPTVCVPLVSKNKVLGVMTLLAESERGIPHEEVALITAIGRQVGVAIENADLFKQVQRLAVLEERDRIGREMHDGLAQMLGYMNLKIRTAEQLVKRGDLDSALAELQAGATVTQEAYADVREAILGLRTSVAPHQGFVGALKEYLRKHRAHSSFTTELEVDGDGDFELPPEAEMQLIRIIQEALANVRKHARANHVWLRVRPGPTRLQVIIEDDGQGFNLSEIEGREGHFGLQTMKERAESVGGDFHIASVPGFGTAVQVTVPIASEGGKTYGAHQDIAGGRSRTVS